MTKKQYFLLLWIIGSLDSFYFIVYRTITIWLDMGYLPQGEIVSIATALVTIILFGIFLYIGLHCAQRIGARLLLLQENYRVLNDIVKPAVVAGSLYAIAV